LFLTFFVGVLCLKLPGAFFATLVPEVLDWTVSHRRVMWAFALVVPLALICAVLYTIAMTRSTRTAWKQPGGKLWASTFYLLVIAAGPMAFFSNYDDEMLEYWWASVRGKYDPITAYADPHLGRIVVRGPMEFGSADALQAVLDKNPKFTLVQIESPGGFVIEGMRMARMLEQRKMDTVSLEGCASACTFLLAAGVERYLGPDVRVGFHRSGHWYGPVETHWSETDHKIANYYRQRGAQEAFVQKALTPSIREIWVAPHADMFTAGYATLRWSERKSGY
jgi:membrane-bound ClpP family serine protease